MPGFDLTSPPAHHLKWMGENIFGVGLSEKKLLDSPMLLLPCRRHQILFFMQFLARWRAKNCELRE
jgi:hypothetical protein